MEIAAEVEVSTVRSNKRKNSKPDKENRASKKTVETFVECQRKAWNYTSFGTGVK